MADDPRFIHLRVHTVYSLLEGTIHVDQLIDRCKEQGAPAVAVTDTGNLFAALEFSEIAADNGVQPIIGCQLDVAFDQDPDRHDANSRAPAVNPLVLLARNAVGYDNLVKLNSHAFLKSEPGTPHVDLEQLERRSEGLICLTGGATGPVGRLILDGHIERARDLVLSLSRIFGDGLYVEIQRHPTGDFGASSEQRASEPVFLDIAYDLGLPVVATNDVHFDRQEMYAAHDALLCIREGAFVDQKEPRRQLSEHHYLKSADEMAELFDDLPEALETTVEIAQRCAFRVPARDPILPRLAENEMDELRRQAEEGLARRLETIEHAVPVEEYRERLDFELGVIETMGFAGYFLIVADVVQWAKGEGIAVGPGRGSGAGSLVAYALTITDLDPLRYSLLFERFMNPERVSMPDFDIDFCVERREEVISYVQDRYGRDQVAQIITFGALLSRAAIRDVGRVLQIPYRQVDRLAKMIPVDGVKPVSVRDALVQQPEFAEAANAEPVVARLLDYAARLEGVYRNASTHAAGVVVGDRPLDDLIPIYKDPRSSMPVSQFSMKWVERAGLVKLDFLGLKTLTIIEEALDLLRQRGVDIDISSIPLDDSATFDLYASAQTVAIFQVEGAGMKDALRRMRPTTIADIVALVALYRPGPMESIPTYCNIKNGEEQRKLLHASIDPILDETHGIIIYQEQVMQIVRAMAGYSLGGADMVRRAMGKKIQSAMDAEMPKFLEGARANGVDSKKAREVWDLLNKFANYGFNKSHAVAYAVVSYQTAWLKAHHPVEFMAAVMNADLYNTDKLHVYREEIERLGIDLRPPCVNQSCAKFVVRDGRIHYALGGLKSAGAEGMRLIEQARQDGGSFSDIFDFARRVDLKKLGRRQLETLARAGAFDGLDGNRARILEAIDLLTSFSTSARAEQNSNQIGLFGEKSDDLPPPKLPAVDEWQTMEKLQNEHEAVGYYLSGHPLDEMAGDLGRLGVTWIADLEKRVETSGNGNRRRQQVVSVAGAIIGRQERRSGKGNMLTFVQLSDPTGGYEVMMFADDAARSRGMLQAGKNVVLSVEVGGDNGTRRLQARNVEAAEEVVARLAPRDVRVFVDGEHAIRMVVQHVSGHVKSAPNGSRGSLHLVMSDPQLPGDVEVAVPLACRVTTRVRKDISRIEGVRMIDEIDELGG